MKKDFDVIIIGGGPGGYSAALYAVRSGFSTLLIEKMAAGGEKHPPLACHGILDALQHGDIPGGGAVIVADQSGAAVGIGADHADGANSIRVQGQQTVVFQQHAGFPGGLLGQCDMLVAFHHFVGDVIKFGCFPHDAQHVPGGENMLGSCGDLLLGHKTLLQGFHQMLVGIAAV